MNRPECSFARPVEADRLSRASPVLHIALPWSLLALATPAMRRSGEALSYRTNARREPSRETIL